MRDSHYSLAIRTTLVCLLVTSYVLTLNTAYAEPSETMVVTGSRIARADEQVSESLTVITRADIRRHQYRNLSEALVAVPGVYAASSGGLGAQTSIFIRGSESNHVLVLIDGVRVNNPASDNLFEFSDIPLSDIERIEITRGGQSAQYGSDALGGVIHILTRRRQDGARVSIERGSFNNRMLALSFGQDIGTEQRTRYALSTFYRKSDGDSFTPGRLRGAAAKENDAHRNAQLGFNLDHQYSDSLHFAFSSGYTEAQTETDEGVGENTLSETNTYAKRTALSISGFYFDKLWQPKLRFTRYVKDTNNRGSFPSQSRGERLLFAWDNVVHIHPEWTLAFGVDNELERVRADVTSSPQVSAQERTHTLYSELQWAPSPHWKFSYSLRNDDHEGFSSERSHRAGLVWTDQRNTLVRADYATGFRAPTLSERLQDFPTFLFSANPDLKPETNRHWQVGIEQRFKSWDWGTSYFHNRLRNLIVFQSDPVTFSSTLINRNRDKFEGLESFITWRYPDLWTLRVDHTMMRIHEDDRPPPLVRHARRKLNIDLNLTAFNNYDINLRINYTGPRKDFDRVTFATKSVGGYTVAHLTARYRLHQDLSVFARINNLFNKRYEPVDGFAAESRNFNVGVTSDF